jgi:hypothetical protein
VGRINSGGEYDGSIAGGLPYCRGTPSLVPEHNQGGKDMPVTVEWGDEAKTFTVTRVVGAYEPLEIADSVG